MVFKSLELLGYFLRNISPTMAKSLAELLAKRGQQKDEKGMNLKHAVPLKYAAKLHKTSK